MLVQLLPELLEKVLDHLSRADLHNLSTCNSALNQRLKRFLWTTVRISISNILRHDIMKQPSLLNNFTYTKTLHLTNENMGAYSSDSKGVQELLVRSSNLILEHCNLEVLHSTFTSDGIFRGVNRLHCLAELGLNNTDTNDANVIEVANHLPSLKVLRIGMYVSLCLKPEAVKS